MNATDQTPEAIRAEISRIVDERQALRQNGAGPDELEQNRRRLVEAQMRLSDVLIRTHLGPAAAA